MSQMIVLGTGIVGRAAAWDLVERGHEVMVADIDRAAAERVGAELGTDHTAADAGDGRALTRLFSDADAVVSAVPYEFGTIVADAAVAAGCNYVDFGGNPTVVAAQLGLAEAARSAGIAIVPDCGLAPGLTNVLAFAAVECIGDDIIDRVALRVGALPVNPTGALGYQLAFSPRGLINEYAEPCEILRDGEYATVPPLTETEEVDWPEWGPLEAFHTAGGSSSLPRIFEGRVRRLDYKTLRYPGHGRIASALSELGMFDENPWAVDGIWVTPRAVLLAALEENLPRDEPDVVLVRTWAETVTGGERRAAGYQIVDRHDGRFSALARTTAFPATALIHLLATGVLQAAGAATMDRTVTAAALLPEIETTGIVIEDWTP